MRTHHSYSSHSVGPVYSMSLREFEEQSRKRHRRRMLVIYSLLALATATALFIGA